LGEKDTAEDLKTKWSGVDGGRGGQKTRTEGQRGGKVKITKRGKKKKDSTKGSLRRGPEKGRKGE